MALDEIMDFPGAFVDHFHPERLHQINVSFVVDKLEKQYGGIATNIAYNLSLITKTQTKLLSAVGRDGQHLIDFIKDRGIDTSGIIFDKKLYTASGKVITDKKDNQIWGFYFGALVRSGDIDISAHLSDQTLVIVSPTHSDGFLKVQRQVIEKSIDYVYDPGMSLTWISDADLLEGVQRATYLIGNDYEIAQIERRLGTSVDRIIKTGTKVIVTLGEKGSLYRDTKQTIEVGPFKQCKVVDPTGAGDAFRGGFFGALADGKPIKECLQQGNAIASYAVETYGTVNHKPTMNEIRERMMRL